MDTVLEQQAQAHNSTSVDKVKPQERCKAHAHIESNVLYMYHSVFSGLFNEIVNASTFVAEKKTINGDEVDEYVKKGASTGVT